MITINNLAEKAHTHVDIHACVRTFIYLCVS